MSGINGSSKPSDAVPYGTGVDNPSPSDSGTLSCGGWVAAPVPPFTTSQEMLDGVPAPVCVQLGGTAGATRVGSPQQYSVTISLTGAPLQIVANMADAQNHPVIAVAPQVFAYRYISRQRFVATVDSNGIITPTGRGQCEVEIISSRDCNASFTGATPSGTEGVRASLLVTVVA
jgi:hypothetical protein